MSSSPAVVFVAVVVVVIVPVNDDNNVRVTRALASASVITCVLCWFCTQARFLAVMACRSVRPVRLSVHLPVHVVHPSSSFVLNNTAHIFFACVLCVYICVARASRVIRNVNHARTNSLASTHTKKTRACIFVARVCECARVSSSICRMTRSQRAEICSTNNHSSHALHSYANAQPSRLKYI